MPYLLNKNDLLDHYIRENEAYYHKWRECETAKEALACELNLYKRANCALVGEVALLRDKIAQAEKLFS